MALATQARPPAPPTLNQVFEAEQGLVGLILAEPAAYGRIAAILRDTDWTQNLHRGVFEVVGRFLAEGRSVSLDTVLPRVSDVAPDGAPADLYLAALAARAPASARAESLA
ncbi:MAG: DnaB-like helicase N-terminal domain-containing protein, partial [Methylorubrum rhodinum]|uniref:DnaB-like helicase N-terminal domain-containing protein n=1 Tax=Methylorubrum rhodinum TaxID=29428 RepID=UPI003BAFBC7E